jgi:hypothetical protein
MRGDWYFDESDSSVEHSELRFEWLSGINVRRIDARQVHPQRARIASVGPAICDTSTAVPSTNAGLARITLRLGCWRVSQGDTLLNI